MTIVSLENVEKIYTKGKESVEVLNDINLEIEEGDFVALMGPSGSGKTTLLNLIGGIDQPTGGRVVVGGQELARLSSKKLAKWRSEHIGFIFQFYNLLPVLSAQRNVELPLLLTKLTGKQRKKNAEIALQIVGLEDRGRHKPGELSGGQQQRVAIARALAMEPRVLMFDEPTSALDPEMIKEVLDVMRELAHTGITMLVVTHEMGFAREVADRVVFMCDGQVLVDAPPAEFFGAPKDERQASFLSKVL